MKFLTPDTSKLSREPTVCLTCGNDLGESIVWDSTIQRLVWVNIHKKELYRGDPFSADKPQISKFDKRIGAVGLTDKKSLILAFESGFSLFDEDTETVTSIAEIEHGHPMVRLNDGRASPDGSFVCGGMHEEKIQKPTSSIYRLNSDKSVDELLTGVKCANSTCWSPDGRYMYFSDMPSRRIDVFRYDSGELKDRRPFFIFEKNGGLPDGSTVDSEGYVWNAVWGAGKIIRISPDGILDREILLPTSNPTCLAFGGPNLDMLFITTAKFGLTKEQLSLEQRAGDLLVYRPGVQGLQEHRFHLS
jgi:L-arabinonolactonase